jgi:MATE family multidrug resistance protein
MSAPREGGTRAGYAREAMTLANLAWPVTLAHLGTMLLGVVDVWMVGQLGERQLAATSLGHTWAFSVQVLLLGAAAGLDPLFSQAHGAGRPDRVGETLVRGAALLLFLAVPVTAMHLLAGPALTLAGQPAEEVALAHGYVRIRAWSVIPFAIAVLARQCLQGTAVMWPGAVAIVVGNVVNFVLNGILIFGLFGAPRLEVEGAAWATVASSCAMAATLVAIGFPWFRAMKPRLGALHDGPALAIMARSALPVSLQVGLEGWGFSLGTIMAGWLGPTALAANAVALTLASLAFMVPLGLSSAGATRVGNLLGAGREWRVAAWTAVGLGIVVMGASGSVFAALPGPVASLFTPEPAVLAVAASLLPVAAGFGFFDGAQVVLFGVLRGAGDTTLPAVANIVGYYVIGLPLGAWLAFGVGFGVVGLWMGLAVALAIVSLILAIRLTATVRRGGYRVG